MTIRCFRWDDAGAPQLGAASSLSVVLEKCLVDGYGTQAGLGWGKIKSPSGNVIAFRPPARASARPWMVVDDRWIDRNVGGGAVFGLYSDVVSISNDAVVEGVADLPLSSKSYVSYRREDSAILPWLIISDSELDYFYLVLPWSSTSWIRNAGAAGVVSNMGSFASRRGVGFSIAVFGSLPNSMAVEGNNFVITRINKQVQAWDSVVWGGNDYSGAVAALTFENGDGNSVQMGELVFWKSISGLDKSTLATLTGMASVGPSGKKTRIQTPNVYSNKVVLAVADWRLLCNQTGMLRGRLGGIYPLLNTRGVSELGIDNVMNPVRQSINGSDRVLLPVLAASLPISYYGFNNGSGYNNFDYVFIDLTGPW